MIPLDRLLQPTVRWRSPTAGRRRAGTLGMNDEWFGVNSAADQLFLSFQLSCIRINSPGNDPV
jgi:hypothetical protein